jgi:hypothetical protein
MLEQMLALGLLTDAAGNKFESLEDAGIKFGTALEDVVSGLKDLVDVLKRIYGITSTPPGGPPPGVPGLPGAGVEGGPAGEGGQIPGLALGGHITSSGLAYLHAGELVTPSADSADSGPAYQPGGGGRGGGETIVVGGRGGKGGAGVTIAAPYSPKISITGAGNDYETARMMNRILRDNLSGFTSNLEAVAMRVNRRL